MPNSQVEETAYTNRDLLYFINIEELEDDPFWNTFDAFSDLILDDDNVYKRIKNISPAPFSSYLSASTIARIINEIQDAFNENTGSSTSNQ